MSFFKVPLYNRAGDIVGWTAVDAQDVECVTTTAGPSLTGTPCAASARTASSGSFDSAEEAAEAYRKASD